MDDTEGLPAAIEKIRKLGVEASGVETVRNFKLPDGLLPDVSEIPLRVKTGASASLSSARALIDEWRISPERRKGTAQVTTLRAFIDLVKRHADESTALFAKTVWPEPRLTAVIDYHTTAKTPRFGQHRVEYKFPLTPEFSAWIKTQGVELTQIDFAQFLEDHVMDLAVPTPEEAKTLEPAFRVKFASPIDLVELSRGLEINVDSKIKTSTKLQSGESSIFFESKHTDGTGQEVHVPGLFMIQLRAFVDGEPVRLPARLRYRPKPNGIIWTFSLYKWEEALRTRVAEDLSKATESLGLPAYEGSPEA